MSSFLNDLPERTLYSSQGKRNIEIRDDCSPELWIISRALRGIKCRIPSRNNSPTVSGFLFFNRISLKEENPRSITLTEWLVPKRFTSCGLPGRKSNDLLFSQHTISRKYFINARGFKECHSTLKHVPKDKNTMETKDFHIHKSSRNFLSRFYLSILLYLAPSLKLIWQSPPRTNL